MKILIIGGTGDALLIAQSLIRAQHNVTYSIAGIVRQPQLDCRILSGGFRVQQTQSGEKQFDNGAQGLQWHLDAEAYDLIVDATHPYAVKISKNLALASKKSGIPAWRYLRAPWKYISSKDVNNKDTSGNVWLEYASLEEIISQLKPYKRPFFTVGRLIFSQTDLREKGQHWLVRSAGVETANIPDISELKAIGPFKLKDEMALFTVYGIDVLISKNSGGEAVAAKLEAARELGIPVFLLQRPDKPPVDRCFSSTQDLIEQINNKFA